MNVDKGECGTCSALVPWTMKHEHDNWHKDTENRIGNLQLQVDEMQAQVNSLLAELLKEET